MPRALTPHLAIFLSLAIGHLDVLLPSFQHYHVIRGGGSPPPVTTTDDPDQEISLAILAASIQDLLSQVARAKRAKEWYGDQANIRACVRAIAGWTQMTEEDVRISLAGDLVFYSFVPPSFRKIRGVRMPMPSLLSKTTIQLS